MENQNHKMDEIFRQRLHDVEVPPPPFVWPAVEQALQKRRRRLALLWIFAFGTVLASVWLWQSKWWDPTPLAHHTVAPSSEQKDSALTLNPSSLSTEPETSLAIIAAMQIENSVSSDYQTNDLPAVPRATSIVRKKPEDIALTVSKDLKTANGLATPNPTGLEPQASSVAELEVAVASGASNETGAIAFSDAPLEILRLGQVTSTLKRNRGIAPSTFNAKSRRKKTNPKFCYDFAKHPSAILVDIYGGPSLAQRSLTSRLDDEPYLNQRLATERRSLAMNAGIRASLLFNRNLLVRTGLHYDQVTEVFEYIDPTTVIYRLQWTPGNPIPDTLGVEYGENYLKTYNRYGFLDVPLLFGVEMRKGRSGLSINAGVSANVLFQKSGVIIDPLTQEPARFGSVSNDPNDPGPKTKLSQEVFRANVGLSASASIQWYWHITPHFRLFTEPSFRQVLRPVSLGSHPVEQRYSIFGVRLGVTRIF